MYKEARQVRTSMDLVRSNIVEGYGRRCYKNDLVRFFIYSLSSGHETAYQLRSFKNKELYKYL